MKLKISLLIIFYLSFVGCKAQSKPCLLQYINHVNTLEILTVDDQCGEWGGNEKSIIIYRDSFKGELLADYVEKTKNCKSEKKSEITKSKKRIKLTETETELILESVNELCEKKLNREDFPSHSGIFNRIMLKDSSMIVSDFPSVKLKSLSKLITELETK
ncbi:hypothetical protein [Flavobacterium ardleyense]|uniref:hypothetical protein n=1 Tax=Flavobacterium ardleyense TaxID=2038737 RepID=UPI00298BC9BB|nr:hypothetical protein [Flavobacterium ardleyense]